VPVEPAGSVLTDHAVAVRDGNIEAVLPAGEARQRFPGYEQVDLPEHVLIPGLVNAHTHAAMTLMRGLADDLPLMRWLEEHIWPAEKRHVSAQFVRDGTLAACAEMLRGGITCFNDMYFFPDAALESALEAGMRSVHGIIVIEFPSAYAADAADYLRKGLEVRDRYRDERLASFCIAPHAPYTVADASLRQVAVLAAELDLPVHMHVHETEHEVQGSLAEHGVRPLERLRRLNLLGPNLIAVHAVHLNAEEIALLAHHASSVVHCPSSNLKLASGFAPVAKLAKAGVNIALGTDGAASNNRLDMFQEMRTAALLAKAVAGDAQAMPAHDVLRAATLGGAQALGLGERIGSIRAGKAADLAAVALRGPELAPFYDAVSHLVYAAGREHVTHVWIDGELQLAEGKLRSPAFSRLDTRLPIWQNALRPLAGP
jgi:5-methylthioadenosine/S-adenosylhomocysteine deaminase